MKKFKLLWILLLYISFFAYSQDNKIITVLDFETSGVSKAEMTLFVDFISATVSDYEQYTLIDRRQRENILAETAFSNSGCADESCAIEIGQVLSAAEMIVGSLGSIGSIYILNIKLIDVQTGKTLDDVSNQYENIEELVRDSNNVVVSLLGETIKTTEMEQADRSHKPEEPNENIVTINQNHESVNLEKQDPIEKINTSIESLEFNLSVDMLELKKKNESKKLIGNILLVSGILSGTLDLVSFIASGGPPSADNQSGQVIFASLTASAITGILFGILVKNQIEPIYDLNGNLTDY